MNLPTRQEIKLFCSCCSFENLISADREIAGYHDRTHPDRTHSAQRKDLLLSKCENIMIRN